MSDIFRKLTPSKRKKVLLREIKRGVGKFGLFKEGDRVLIGVSGGIDSLSMLHLLADKSSWWSRFVDFIPVHIFSGFSHEEEKLENIIKFTEKLGMKLEIIRRPEIAETALGDKRPQNPCFICSRMRRKALVETASEMGANKIALGHHREDVIGTLLINIFWGREISTMMPDQPLFDGKFRIIRPMFMINRTRISNFARSHRIFDQSADCPIEGETKRDYVSRLLDRLERENPGIKSNIFRSMFHPKPDYLLGRYVCGGKPEINSDFD